MLSGESKEAYTFPVEVNLVILGHNENTKCARVYFLKDSCGKLYIPEKKMISGKNCYEIFECMEKGDISKDHPIIFAISLYGKQYQKELFDPYIHPDAQEQV